MVAPHARTTAQDDPEPLCGSGGQCLDVGRAQGPSVGWLRGRKVHATCDLDRRGLKAGEGVSGSSLALPFADASFDVLSIASRRRSRSMNSCVCCVLAAGNGGPTGQLRLRRGVPFFTAEPSPGGWRLRGVHRPQRRQTLSGARNATCARLVPDSCGWIDERLLPRRDAAFGSSVVLAARKPG